MYIAVTAGNRGRVPRAYHSPNKVIQICVFFHDHMPAHVHAIADSEMARITLECPGVDPIIEYATDGISPRELRWLKDEVASHRDKFLMEWSKIHGDPCQDETE